MISDLLPCGVRKALGVGFQLQSRMLGLATQAVPELLDPRTYLRLTGDMARRSADGVRAFAAGPGSVASGALEVENKSEVFLLVQSVGLILGVPCTFPLPLGELVERAYALGSFPALWAVEGLGHDFAASYLASDRVPRRILDDAATRDLPAQSLLMLHAGIGLAFAENRLEAIGWRAAYPEVRRAVAEVVELCRANSRPGYLGAALESLGLETRLFFPQLVPAVDQALREVASPATLDYFWHGAGRALYFFPSNFMPFSLGQAYAAARREAPDERARRNASAGLTWAVTLVNQRQPRVMADLVVGPHGDTLRADPGFTNGVASATIMRCETTPGAPFVETFRGYRPRDARTRALWDELIRAPTAAALDVVDPILRDTDRLDEVFRYHDLARLAAGLEDQEDAEAPCV